MTSNLVPRQVVRRSCEENKGDKGVRKRVRVENALLVLKRNDASSSSFVLGG